MPLIKSAVEEGRRQIDRVMERTESFRLKTRNLGPGHKEQRLKEIEGPDLQESGHHENLGGKVKASAWNVTRRGNIARTSPLGELWRRTGDDSFSKEQRMQGNTSDGGRMTGADRRAVIARTRGKTSNPSSSTSEKTAMIRAERKPLSPTAQSSIIITFAMGLFTPTRVPQGVPNANGVHSGRRAVCAE